jgi:hypothetical protein
VHVEPDEAGTIAALDSGAAEISGFLARRLIDTVT